jgi:hypothetical protein
MPRLLARNAIKGTPDQRFFRTTSTERRSEEHLTTLAQGVADRIKVREGITVPKAFQTAAFAALERILLARAWDVSAHFAGADCGWSADLRNAVTAIVKDEAGFYGTELQAAFDRAIWDILVSPERREAEILGALCTAAFGLQLLLSTPRQVLFQQFSLPERVYLDASVLMPAITAGHPLSPVYVDCLSRLSAASGRFGRSLEVVVGFQFLNEIISHRKLAMELVAASNLEDVNHLRDHVEFYGATNTNVYVAAYSAHVGRERKPISFQEFLKAHAPYRDEKELAAFLSGQGIRPFQVKSEEQQEKKLLELTGRLASGYGSLEPTGTYREKPNILVQHEAQQLLWIQQDEEIGRRVIFVTADTRLRRVIAKDEKLRRYSGATLSHIGLLGLVEVMVGIDADRRSAARLIWSHPLGDEKQTLFEYFVRLGLREYREGMGLELESLAARMAQEASEDMQHHKRELFPKDLAAAARQAKFMDEYQDRFFRYWREAIEQREEKS